MAISVLLTDPNKLMYIGMAFWLFVAVIAVAAIWYYKSHNREKQKTIRLAIEKGVPLDAALIESLDKGKPAKPEDYSIGGYVSVATGIGIIILGFFIGRIAADALYPLVGVGILVILIGISLILVAKTICRRTKGHENGNQRM